MSECGLIIDGVVRSSEAIVDIECKIDRELPAKKTRLVCHTIRLLQGTFKHRVASDLKTREIRTEYYRNYAKSKASAVAEKNKRAAALILSHWLEFHYESIG
jgi:hypothetical protein